MSKLSAPSKPLVLLVATVGLLCLSMPAMAAKVAIFVKTVGGNTVGQKTGAALNWMAQRLLDHPAARKKGLQVFDRGLFFSRSRALAAKRWLRKAKRQYSTGLQNYTADADAALSALRRAAQFYHYAHPYYLDRDAYQHVLMLLSLLLYKKKEDESAWRYLSRGLLMKPNFIPKSKLGSLEQTVIKAAQCKLAQQKPGKVIIFTRKPASAVFVNNRLLGFGSLTFAGARPGEYYVSVREDGLRRWGRPRIRLRSGATKTLRARNMTSPQASNYEGLCTQILPLKEGEQLTDKLKEAARSFGVDRLWFGCFQPNAAGNAGTMQWFSFVKAKQAKRGTLPMPVGFTPQFQLLAKLLKAQGYPNPAKMPSSPVQYPALKKPSSCPDFQKALKNFTTPKIKYYVVYTKYGFRIQGKLLKETPTVIQLQVSTTTNVLQTVSIPKSMVKLKWKLPAQQQGGLRLGERVVIQTKFGLSAYGRLVAIDVAEIKIKTRHGVEAIPRTMIRKIHKRDR